MKIIYHHKTITTPGGMERILIAKMEWLASLPNVEVILVTTDDDGRAPFFPISDKIRHIDLDINYYRGDLLPFFRKARRFAKLKRLHFKRLSELLIAERPDVTISLYPAISGFIPKIKDGSLKILEFHFSRFFRLHNDRRGLTHIADIGRTLLDPLTVRKFDKFVVLSDKDRKSWGRLSNIFTIPNPIIPFDNFQPVASPSRRKRVIAVGRLVYQKGYDMLLDAWKIVKEDIAARDWHLDFFGKGPQYAALNMQMHALDLSDSVSFNPPTLDIAKEFASSDIHVLSSHYEGQPLVIGEAMYSSIPSVAFDCPTGPRELIDDNRSGILVPPGNVNLLAEAILSLIKNEDLRLEMGKQAKLRTAQFSMDAIMNQWLKIYNH